MHCLYRSHVSEVPMTLFMSYKTNIMRIFGSKIEKVPRGIRGEKSSKDMASSRNLVSTINLSHS